MSRSSDVSYRLHIVALHLRMTNALCNRLRERALCETREEFGATADDAERGPDELLLLATLGNGA